MSPVQLLHYRQIYSEANRKSQILKGVPFTPSRLSLMDGAARMPRGRKVAKQDQPDDSSGLSSFETERNIRWPSVNIRLQVQRKVKLERNEHHINSHLPLSFSRLRWALDMPASKFKLILRRFSRFRSSWNSSRTLWFVLADVSIKPQPQDLAKSATSRVGTSRLVSSHLLPTSISGCTGASAPLIDAISW